MATAPSVIVTDQYGNPVSGVTVAFAVATGGGSRTGGSPTTNSSGIAAVGNWTLGTTAGSNTLTATVAALSPVTFTATGTADAATQVQVETAANGSETVVASQSLLSGSSIPVYAISRDQYSNFVANPSATWSMVTTTGGVATSDLSTTSGKSAVFTGHLVGTGKISGGRFLHRHLRNDHRHRESGPSGDRGQWHGHRRARTEPRLRQLHHRLRR